MMQRDPIPDSGFPNGWDERVTNLGERNLERTQTGALFWRRVEPDADH
jgi:hypothetical protein